MNAGPSFNTRRACLGLACGKALLAPRPMALTLSDCALRYPRANATRSTRYSDYSMPLGRRPLGSLTLGVLTPTLSR